jgi:Zn-dependent peptidase ImmA (M78 family)/transcriptional regulator with XRE-family HTH domain
MPVALMPMPIQLSPPRSTTTSSSTPHPLLGCHGHLAPRAFGLGIVALDLDLFSNKLRRIRELLRESVGDVAVATSISESRLTLLESASAEPTGDEVLILADHFREDFRFFISNEQKTVLERTEKLFRAYDTELNGSDRRAIQEFLFLCDNEAFLSTELGRMPSLSFSPVLRGDYFKGHGLDAARDLRVLAGCRDGDVPDVFHILRRLGFHVFRRRLDNKKISGLFLDHPTAGPSLLINYTDDVYRQRFTAAHEAAHALFDRGQEFVVSFSTWKHSDLREIRADTFAGGLLIPPGSFSSLRPAAVDESRLLDLAAQLKVSVAALLKALERDSVLTKEQAGQFKGVRLPRGAKDDPEVPVTLTGQQRTRRVRLLEGGLSSHYLDLCCEALQRGIVTEARLLEMVLIDDMSAGDVVALSQGVRGRGAS